MKMKLKEIFDHYSPHEKRIYRPYLIAEAGVNHEGKMDLAKRLIDEAKQGGADAIKFQTYKAETIASKDSPAYWDTSKEPTDSQFKLFKKYDRFWKTEFEELKKYCDQSDIEFLSTPFDVESARFLNDLMDVFKISSSDITNRPFVEFIAGFNKPILLSTGASYLYEIEEAVGWIYPQMRKILLLHCVLNYPTLNENANLGMILGLKNKFPDFLVGYSDHTLPQDMRLLETATLLGAVVLEKHFTHDKMLPGNDHYHAMDYRDLKTLVKRLDELLSFLGSFDVTALASEESARMHARRSLVANKNIPKGKLLELSDLTWKRPAHGISPKEIEQVIGRKASQDIPADSILKWRDFE